MKKWMGKTLLIAGVASLLFTSVGQAASSLKGTIDIDGSSTVFPITEAVAEEFGKLHTNVRVPVGVSGTGGGFKRFCAGETAISNASRPIKDSEKKACKDKGISYLEFAVAYDGLSVLVNPKNTWVKSLTVEQLHAIFKADSTVKTWKDVNSAWPDEAIKIYSPGSDSGTFDYFTEAINKKAQSSRNDKQITFSEDDNVLVQGIANDKNAIGYFGFAYYEENKKKLKLVPVDAGKGAITPTPKTIANGTYAPLSRPLFIYVNKKEIARPEVKEFTKFYLQNAGKLATEVGYIALSSKWYQSQLKRVK
ncbi:PstS family phosphate ABC transporter substrate-binding protein [Paenibacillus harenae]|uniref:PstS family phosphate ABC transporter substrate-binding protein n=1 Tax=Paenibacillus harenae TaxID=306543 RepID=UPI001FDFA508|nr:PstS family phosphate ABC transporter substrate-binding protein [Paenibacillus harenae]